MKNKEKEIIIKNDKVEVIINRKKREGIVFKTYPSFALIQFKHYKESFLYDEIKLIQEEEKEEKEKLLELDELKIS